MKQSKSFQRQAPVPRAPKRVIILEDTREAVRFLGTERSYYNARRPNKFSQKRGGKGSHNGRSSNQWRLKKPSTSPRLLAPCTDGLTVVGDSIALRYARSRGLNAPRNMPLCQGGLTTTQLKEALEECSAFSPSGDVLISIGTNDAIKGDQVAASDLQSISALCKSRGAQTIIYMLLPPNGDEAINAAVEAVNAVLKGHEKPAEKIYIIDTYKPFLENKRRNEALFEKFFAGSGKPDGIHPNQQGLEAIKKAVDDLMASLIDTSS